MAKGVVKSFSSYYSDTDTYTGSGGSETNPWAIEDVYDFLKIGAGSNDIFGYCELVNDIDFNDHETYKYGINNVRAIIGNSASGKTYIIGNGHDIRNMVLYNYSQVCIGSGINGGITDVNFVNLICINCSSTSGYFVMTDLCMFKDCNFSVLLSGSDPRFLFCGSVMIGCTFNIFGCTANPSTGICLGYNSYEGGLTGYYKQNCHFHFNDFTVYANFDDNRNYYERVFCGVLGSTTTSRYASIVNCYFTGTINTTGSSYGLDHALFYYLRMTNCYFAVKIKSSSLANSYMTWKYTDSTVQSISFIDKTLMSGYTLPTMTNLVQLTTTQAKSYSDVFATGFPVIPITDDGDD